MNRHRLAIGDRDGLRRRSGVSTWTAQECRQDLEQSCWRDFHMIILVTAGLSFELLGIVKSS